MNIYLIILVLILIFIIFKWIIIYIKENFKNRSDNSIFFFSVNKLKKNESKKLYKILNNYLKNVSQHEIFFKTGKNIEKSKLVNFYINNILNFTIKEKMFLKKNVAYIINYCNNYTKIINNWKFIKISDKIDKGMPFTVDKYIFLSNKLLDKIDKNQINKEFMDTLIHEKIHIIQRFSQKKFNEFYKNNLNIINSKNLFITDYWKKKHLKNPDGLDINWIYKYNNNYYLPLLIFQNNDINQIIIKLNKKLETTKDFDNIRNFPIFKNIPDNISVYHPNELVAYILPKIILKNNSLPIELKEKYYKLLDYLK